MHLVRIIGPTSFSDMHPYAITLPPPCLTVGQMHYGWYSSPIRRPSLLKTRCSFTRPTTAHTNNPLDSNSNALFANCIWAVFKEMYSFLRETLPRSSNSLKRLFMVYTAMVSEYFCRFSSTMPTAVTFFFWGIVYEYIYPFLPLLIIIITFGEGVPMSRAVFYKVGQHCFRASNFACYNLTWQFQSTKLNNSLSGFWY